MVSVTVRPASLDPLLDFLDLGLVPFALVEVEVDLASVALLVDLVALLLLAFLLVPAASSKIFIFAALLLVFAVFVCLGALYRGGCLFVNPFAKTRIRTYNRPQRTRNWEGDMPPKSLSGQYAYARGGKVVGYNSRRSEAHDGGWVWFTKDERDRYKKASDAQKTAIIKTATKRARGNPDANVPFGRVNTTGIVGDPHAASRKTAISRAKKNLGKDDGDALPSGFYEQDTEDIDGDGDTEEIKRTGKTKSLDLYSWLLSKPGRRSRRVHPHPGELQRRGTGSHQPATLAVPDTRPQLGDVPCPTGGTGPGERAHRFPTVLRDRHPQRNRRLGGLYR